MSIVPEVEKFCPEEFYRREGSVWYKIHSGMWLPGHREFDRTKREGAIQSPIEGEGRT